MDKKIFNLISKENQRQKEELELIPSENYTSKEVRQALSSRLVNKYSEGYAKKRYYAGNKYVDEIELLAIDRAKKLFKVPFANVQPYSGSIANLAVYFALCKPNEVIMGQSLNSGGHLTHGHNVSITGKYFKAIQYNILPQLKNKDLFDYGEILKLAKKHKPKIIWVGATAYPLKFNYQKFSEIAKEVNAYLVANISHIAGLIVAGYHPSPVNYVHIITTTTHKTLRGPRGAIIMVTKRGLEKDPELPFKINKAVFPGIQGGPHDNQTAAIAVCLDEASKPSFKKYAFQIIKNSRVLAYEFKKGGLKLIGNGTQNHLILIDLTPTLGKGTGIFVEKALEFININVNKNTIVNDQSSPFYPSGIRLGTPAVTTRGMREKQMAEIANYILQVVEILKTYNLPTDKEKIKEYLPTFEKQLSKNKQLKELKIKVKKLAFRYPIP